MTLLLFPGIYNADLERQSTISTGILPEKWELHCCDKSNMDAQKNQRAGNFTKKRTACCGVWTDGVALEATSQSLCVLTVSRALHVAYSIFFQMMRINLCYYTYKSIMSSHAIFFTCNILHQLELTCNILFFAWAHMPYSSSAGQRGH